MQCISKLVPFARQLVSTKEWSDAHHAWDLSAWHLQEATQLMSMVQSNISTMSTLKVNYFDALQTKRDVRLSQFQVPPGGQDTLKDPPGTLTIPIDLAIMVPRLFLVVRYANDLVKCTDPKELTKDALPALMAQMDVVKSELDRETNKLMTETTARLVEPLLGLAEVTIHEKASLVEQYHTKVIQDYSKAMTGLAAAIDIDTVLKMVWSDPVQNSKELYGKSTVQDTRKFYNTYQKKSTLLVQACSDETRKLLAR